MGTRNLTIVKQDGQVKVAQYGQWDGYLSGQGKTIWNFIKGVDLDQFRKAVKNCKYATQEEIDQSYANAGVNRKDGWITLEESQRMAYAYPSLHRDTGAKVLDLILENEGYVLLRDDIEFWNDSLFCEYSYVIDLDNDKLECYHSKDEKFAEFAFEDIKSGKVTKEEFLKSEGNEDE